jgi:putative phage-type endonuclease
MNHFYDIFGIYKQKIITNEIVSATQLKNLIITDLLYEKLDSDEKNIIIDVLTDAFNKKKIEKNQISNNTVINKITMTDNQYTFGNKTKIFETEKKPYVFKPKINNTINTIIKDPSDSSEGSLLSSTDKAVFVDDVNEELYEKRKKQFESLRQIVSPEQCSPAWFDQRTKSITASDCGCVLGENKYEPVYNFVLKKVFGSSFGTNVFCHHGKKYENVVALMYELINDVSLDEFGLLLHPTYNFLAASPDGICSPYCRDKITKSPLVGRMIEIKCPYQRKILYTGNIKGEICPDYYWCQVQLQLECCDLDECDFVQCNIQEYKSRQEYIDDTHNEYSYKSKTTGLERGVVIEILPTKLNEDDYLQINNNYTIIKNDAIYDKARFIHQPKLDMTQQELDLWIISELDKLSSRPEVKLNKIIYWRFNERNNTLIKRNKKWFSDNIIIMRQIWAYVEILRTNNNIALEWKEWIDSQNTKYKDKIMNKLVELIKNNELWTFVVNKIQDLKQLTNIVTEQEIFTTNNNVIDKQIFTANNNVIEEQIFIKETNIIDEQHNVIEQQIFIEDTVFNTFSITDNKKKEKVKKEKVKKEKIKKIKKEKIKKEKIKKEKIEIKDSKKNINNNNNNTTSKKKPIIFTKIIIDSSDDEKTC